MNICFFHGGFAQHGGIGRVVSILANGMAKQIDYKVYSLSLFRSGEGNAYEIDPAVHDDFLYDQARTMTKAMITDGIRKLCRYLRENRISVLVACGALYYPLGIISAKICRIKSICWEHTNPEFAGDYKFQNIGREFGANHSDINVVISREAKANYDQRFPKKKNILIWNPAADELFEQAGSYNPDSRRLISAGRLSYPKNFGRLLEIAGKLREKEADWHWDIYGDGEEREQLEEKIEKLGLRDLVTLKGSVNDLYTRYHQYMAIVMTSRYEGFPMVLIEGAANGLPMIAFDVRTGPKEIIRDGENGFLIHAEEDDAMVEAITRLMEDRQLRIRMSRASAESVQGFKLKNVLQLWDDLLKSTVDSSTEYRGNQRHE